MFKKSTWFLMLLLAFGALVSLAVGFAKAIQVTSSSKTATVTKTIKTESIDKKTVKVVKDSNSFKIAIVGDSIAFGTGDEKASGFSTYLPNYLKPQTTKKVTVDNMGINGQESAGLLGQLQSDKPKALIATADVVLISIGGNDLRSIRSRNNASIDQNEYNTIETAYLKNLKEIFQTIRKDNANAYIVFVGLYNPYEKDAPSYEDTAFMNTWNYSTQKLFENDAKAIYIPTYDIFKYNLNRYLAKDGLHPNALGYQVVSQRIAKSIESILN